MTERRRRVSEARLTNWEQEAPERVLLSVAEAVTELRLAAAEIRRLREIVSGFATSEPHALDALRAEAKAIREERAKAPRHDVRE